MKIGLLTAGLGKAANPRILRAIAEHAERLGFGTLWAPEHVVLFDRYTESKYPYSQDGAFAAPSTIEWMDPFVALTWDRRADQQDSPRDGHLPGART
jgi:alkanesulfonate monooxygenase SsuD/methylene tetrahydromethanopterin reductase-like flavin-dependent oxidoreductase (luciferase family)